MPTPIYVTDYDDLLSKLDSATGGEVFELAPGEYGLLNLSTSTLKTSHGKYASEVTIRSADPIDKAIFSGGILAGVENLKISDLKIEYQPTGELPIYEKVFKIVKGSKSVVIENSVFEGHPVPEGLGGNPEDHLDVKAHGGLVEGLSSGVGFSARESEDITFHNNEVTGFHRAVKVLDVDGAIFTDNYIHDLRSDGLNFISVTNGLIEGNEIRDMRPWRHEEAVGGGDHGDLIQFWTNGTTSPSENIIIRSNILHVRDGDATHSIFMRNEEVDNGRAGEEMFYRNITIEDNLIYNAHRHGISVGEGFEITIQNNTLVQNLSRENGAVTVPEIYVNPASQSVTIIDNVTPGLRDLAGMEAAGFTISGNVITQNTNENAPNYVQDIFIDALSGSNASVTDLQIVPESVADGVGAAISQFEFTPDDLTPVAQYTSGEFSGNDFAFTFNAGLTADQNGLVDDGATFSWDFGDGQTKTSIEVDHTFTTHGPKEVILTVTTADGTVANNIISVNIADPVYVDIDFTNASATDGSSYGATLLKNRDEDQLFEETDFAVGANGEVGLRLKSDSVFTFGRDDTHLFGQDQFSFHFDIQRAAADSGGGDLLYKHVQGMKLHVQDDGTINFTIFNSDAQSFALVTDTKIDDTERHDLVVSYSASDALLAIYLDDALIGSTEMTGLVLEEVYSFQPISLGNPFRDNLEAIIYDFKYLNTAFEPRAATATPIPEDAIYSDGYARGSVESDVFVLGANYTDINSAGTDTFIVTDLSTSSAHRVRNFESGETLDLSHLIDIPNGQSVDEFVRLEERTWGGGTHTFVQIDQSGSGQIFVDAIALTFTTFHSLEDAINTGAIVIGNSDVVMPVADNGISAAGYEAGTAAEDTFILGTDYADINSAGTDRFVLRDISTTSPHRIRSFEDGEVIDISDVIDIQNEQSVDEFVRLDERTWGGGTHTFLQIDQSGSGQNFVDAIALTYKTFSSLEDAIDSGTILLESDYL
ncbi:right-handed parallel beta-helix repeat-containing protein [Shimia sp.]|uniref:right-handed parallel beta-helix repeat-containing protein n=1 Tax=Shimia sp. TaxID=1954381 RepID=UPI003BAD7AE4